MVCRGWVGMEVVGLDRRSADPRWYLTRAECWHWRVLEVWAWCWDWWNGPNLQSCDLRLHLSVASSWASVAGLGLPAIARPWVVKIYSTWKLLAGTHKGLRWY